MQRIYFFNNPVGTQKINFVVSELGLSELIKNDIIPKKAAVFVDTFEKYTGDSDLSLMLTHVDKLVFDNYSKPNEVKFDVNLLAFSILEMYKEMRAEVLKILDNLQVRAITRGLNDVVEMIEKDKQVLRDMPKEFKSRTFESHQDAISKFPKELLEDYEEKYESYLK